VRIVRRGSGSVVTWRQACGQPGIAARGRREAGRPPQPPGLAKYRGHMHSGMCVHADPYNYLAVHWTPSLSDPKQVHRSAAADGTGMGDKSRLLIR
jgi:hypothetical protein